MPPQVSIGPRPSGWAVDAVTGAGGIVVDTNAAEAIVWLDVTDVGGLQEALTRAPAVRWVQLPWAGVEGFAATGMFSDGRTWTCAKGAYAEPVAEHALALALAGLRHLPERARATSWGAAKGRTLFDADVTVIGGGGITNALLALLAPYRVRATVVRRSGAPVAGAARTLTTERLHDALPDAAVVFLALALTPATTGIIGAPELALMGSDAWLVNVSRGGHVVTGDLVRALESGAIGGAALDVTDPEPLPDGHPLWRLALITPHSADWPSIVRDLLAARIRRNVAAFGAGSPLEGLIDPVAGY